MSDTRRFGGPHMIVSPLEEALDRVKGLLRYRTEYQTQTTVDLRDLQALVDNATRYRWLRHGDNDDLVICNDGMGTIFLLRDEQLDAAIDKAVSEGVEHQRALDADEDGPDEEDGPWAAGWAERSQS